MRAIWKGHIRFSLVTIPIRIYSAIDSAQSIKMNQLHKDCNGPVGYDKKCKKCSDNYYLDETDTCSSKLIKIVTVVIITI